MIAIDYSGVAISAITGFREDLQQDEAHIENLIRHVVISTIKGLKQKFYREYGSEVIIACDSGPYWRHDVFEHYKANRKKDKSDSYIPWKLVRKYMDAIQHDLYTHFPYKVISVNGAEADDIIAVMVQDIATRPQEGLLDDGPSKVLIVSRDKDMSQLLTHNNIRQYNPVDKKFVQLEMSPKMYLRSLILTGDSGDGVPNVFSPADSFVSGIRQKPATAKKMQPFLEADNMLHATEDEDIRKRIIENTQLIALSRIPKKLREKIIQVYEDKPNGNQLSVLKYLASKGMKQMIGDIDDF